MTTIVESGRFILSDIRQNNNKYWNVFRYDNHQVETHYGRIGENGQRTVKDLGCEAGAVSFYQSKCREKTAKGYQPVQILEETAPATTRSVASAELEQLAVQQIRYSSPVVRDLVTYLIRRNVHDILAATTMTYDAGEGTFRTPLGIVTAPAIQQARALLAEIADDVVADRYDSPEIVTRINDYLMHIPQDIGHRRSRPRPQDLFPDLDAIRRQNAILDALDASLQEVLAAPKPGTGALSTEETPRLFDVKLELVEDGREIDRIRAKFRQTLQRGHECSHLDVQTGYLVEIAAMRRAFEQDGVKVGNIWELWHGSRVSNLLSILKSGFVIPPSNAPHCTGRMFANGVYFSDQSTKSLNYAYGTWDGRARDEQCFMLLNNVAMGKPYTPRSHAESLPKPGYDSTFAQAGKSGVVNNEMIVYRTSQIDPVFLIQFSRGGR